MGKKTHDHSVHFSAEVEALARANMRKVGARSLNGYVEDLIRRHDELLKACHTTSKIADRWRKLRRKILGDEKRG